LQIGDNSAINVLPVLSGYVYDPRRHDMQSLIDGHKLYPIHTQGNFQDQIKFLWDHMNGGNA
jgi:hypothetical protein